MRLSLISITIEIIYRNVAGKHQLQRDPYSEKTKVFGDAGPFVRFPIQFEGELNTEKLRPHYEHCKYT